MDVDLNDALRAQGLGHVHVEELQLFGQFIGSWSIALTGRGAEQDRGSLYGEVHFKWVLDGEAVQDEWVVPSDGEGRWRGDASGFHGTTFRFYDPSFDTWRCVWIEPSKSKIRQFFGWRQDDEIILFSDDESPYVRWCYTNITASSFAIRRETSLDSGVTWDLEVEMQLTRIVPA